MLATFLRARWRCRAARGLRLAPVALRRLIVPRLKSQPGAEASLQLALPDPAWGRPALMYFGSRGPLQKVTVLLLQPDGKQAWVSKIALRSSADASVENEANWLRRLQDIKSLRDALPELVSQGLLPSGRSYLTVSAWQMGGASLAFTAAHGAFLAALCAETLQWQRWADHPLRHRLAAEIARLQARSAVSEIRLLAEAWQNLLSEADDQRRMPSCVVHGDFAPWNTSRHVHDGAEQLRVFDWEYAHDGGSPLTDFFHFHLIQLALNRADGPHLGHQLETVILPAAQRQLVASLGAESGQVQAALAWYLKLYLIETLSFYLTHSDDLSVEHSIVTGYATLLRRCLARS
ncbi:MAG: phosphotransferase [Rubrivivax sp.]|nr:phosphotransferase [Rubrivivax sp.]